jgi:hypothetical protein
MHPTRRWPLLFLFLAAAGALRGQADAPFQPQFARAGDGSWTVSGDGYAAAINKEGYLSSFKVGGVEAVGEPFAYQPEAKLAADGSEAAGDTLKVHLKGAGEATLDYQFRRDGFTITPTWKGGGFARFRFAGSPSLLGIELLNDKSVTTGGDATHFTERGEIRGVPAVPTSRNQMVRFHYPGFNLHAYVETWGAPFNYESAGEVRGNGWGRPLLAEKRPFPIIFTLERQARTATLPAPVFVPATDKVSSLYYAGEPCVWSLQLGERKSYQYLLDAGVKSLGLSWQVTDIHDTEVAAGKGTLTLDPAAERTSLPVTVRTPGSGYYQALFTLADPSGKAQTSSFRTRFTVINRVSGLPDRDDSLAGKGISDYAIVGMVGVGGIRESHAVGEFFTNQEQKGTEWTRVEGTETPVWMNAKRLDELFNRSQEESKKYGLEWFFQANDRPQYATPATYEAMAYALVSRYKDRCKVWEVENEPNFRYSPQDYTNLCLIPFARGAKRADPGARIMGPGCVSLPHTLRFLDAIYTMGAGKWLDDISTHTYPGPGESWEQFGNLSMLSRLKEMLRTHGDAGKPLWQTEQGYAWDNAPKGQTARYAVRQFLQGWRLGIEPRHQYYFYPHAHGFESWYQAGGGEQGSSESWLPTAAAQRFLAENTVGMKYAGEIESPYPGIFLSRFTGPGEDVVAVWTFDFPYSLPVEAPGLRRGAGYMGNPLELKRGRGGAVTLPLSGEPMYLHLEKGSPFRVREAPFGPNLAAAAGGAMAAASSSGEKNGPPLANDGNWELWENALDLPGRTFWQSGQKDPSPASPDWLEITFPQPRKVDRIVALCYLPAVNPSPRDWEFQAEVNGRWKTLAAAKDDWAWAIHRQFAPVTTAKIRMVVTRINDGWHGDRRWMHVLMGPKATNYTDSKLRVSELEAYGPPAR